MTDLWTFADRAGILTGLILALPVFWTWWAVTFGAKRRQRRQIEQIRREPGRRPGILVVDLLIGKDVRAAVESYCSQDEVLKDIPDDRRCYVRRDQALCPADMPRLIEDIRSAHATLISAGVDKVHYFHAGICIAAALVGAEFGNSAQVILYHHGPGEYINFGLLRLPHAS